MPRLVGRLGFLRLRRVYSVVPAGASSIAAGDHRSVGLIVGDPDDDDAIVVEAASMATVVDG
jgi:hypothetical protein